jgi:hypothetical protein
VFTTWKRRSKRFPRRRKFWCPGSRETGWKKGVNRRKKEKTRRGGESSQKGAAIAKKAARVAGELVMMSPGDQV